MMKTVLTAAALLGRGMPVPRPRARPTAIRRCPARSSMQVCSAREGSALVGACNAYIDGVSDAITSYQAARPQDGRKGHRSRPTSACPATSPAPSSGRPSSWGEQHRNELSGQASAVVIRALLQTFPCQ